MASADIKAGNEEIRRLQAREDYIAMGHKRSRNLLFEEYVARGRRGEPVPTRNRNQFYKWSEEDSWEQIAIERMTADIEDQAKALADARKRGFITLSLLTDKAVERLAREIDSGDSKIAVSVSQDVLNRIGIVGPDKRSPLEKPDDKTKRRALPTAQSTDEEIQQWFAEQNAQA